MRSDLPLIGDAYPHGFVYSRTNHLYLRRSEIVTAFCNASHVRCG